MLWRGRWASPRSSGDLLDAPWPKVDAAALAQDEIELVLQVNGKLRGKLTVPPAPITRAIETPRRASPGSAEARERRDPVKKIIVVPGRLVNVVV